MFKVTNTNSKLGTIVSINLPAGTTCRSNAPCKKGCYALKGAYRYENVKACYAENLRVYTDNPAVAQQDILKQLPLIGFCRIHSSGDFVDVEYLKMIIRICKIAKGVQFLAFTKKYELINNYLASGQKLPKNLKIIFSAWYTSDWTFDNPYDLPVAHVYDKATDNSIPAGAFPCSGKCDKCFACWNIKKGKSIVFNKH